MAIRRREKPLTPAEAIELAKKGVYPYWFGSEPLMAGARDETGVRAYPLDSRMSDRSWLIFFVDPLSLSARDCITYARNWAFRYEPQKLGVMLIWKLSYSFTCQPDWGRREASLLDAPIVSVMDHEGLLHEAFQAHVLPKVLLLHQNKIVFEKSGTQWVTGAEFAIQEFLRKSDPGLPLFEPIAEPEEPVRELFSFDFSNIAPDSNAFGLPNGKVVALSGQWTKEGDRIKTSDPAATVQFESPGQRLALSAECIVERAESEVVVEVVRDYPREGGAIDEDLHLDLQIFGNPMSDPIMKRRASIKVGIQKSYAVFKALPVTHREITLRFPNADKAGVALYGLRFGD